MENTEQLDGYPVSPDNLQIYKNYMSEPYEVVEEWNDLTRLIYAFPWREWDWEALSSNPNLTECFLRDHMDKDWDWDMICCNPSISVRFIMEYGGRHRFNQLIAANPNITMKDVPKFPKRLIYWQYFLCHPNIPLSFIEETLLELDKESHLQPEHSHVGKWAWWWVHTTRHPHLTVDFIRKYIHKLDLNHLSNVQWNIFPIVREFPRKLWSWDSLSANPYLTADIIMDFPNKKWSFTYLSENELKKSKIIQKDNRKLLKSRQRTVARTRIFEEELMTVTWNPHKQINIPRILSEDI